MAGPKKDPEVEAMGTVAGALDAVEDEEARARVIRWAAERYGVTLGRGPARQQQGEQQNGAGGGGGDGDEEPREFNDVSDLFGAAAPTNDEDRVLVVIYWFQEIEGQTTVNAQQVNTALKHLGHGINKITGVFNHLIATTPQQVIQTKKSGTSRQARKDFKVTNVDKTRVRALIAGTAD
jgi:hypothetical protein